MMGGNFGSRAGALGFGFVLLVGVCIGLFASGVVLLARLWLF